ncbi:MAG TPA: OmpH family outer membrane protein [Gemmatimonadales bacterium]|nr:OmpH family outer membrane protein [Gemmatimonadales bacterium]
MARWALPALTVLVITTIAALPADRDSAPTDQTPQAQASVRIAYVNTQVVLRQTPGYQAAESTYTKELEGFQNEVQRLRDQFDSTVAAYQQRAIGLSQADRQAREAELRQMQQQLERRSNELTQRAQERERELVAPLEERIKSVIEGIRAERNLALIFDISAPGNGIVAADRTLDVTATVIQRLREPR